MDDFGLWMKMRYLLKNLDEDTLHERQTEVLDVLGGLRGLLSMLLNSLPRTTLLSLCNLLYPTQLQSTLDISSTNSFQSLPDEMLHSISNYLNIIDLKNLQCCCCQFAIISRQHLSVHPALTLNNNYANKQEILSLISSETNINTKFLHLSSLICSNMSETETLIRHGIISKLVEFIKYDNKKCNFKYKYSAMKILIELSATNTAYLEEICFGYNVLSSFHNLCLSPPVSKLFHYTSSSSTQCNCDLNKNDRIIMETDNISTILSAYRWDPNAKKWRNVCDSCDYEGKIQGEGGKVCVYQNICSGLHKFMFFVHSELALLQYIDNQQGVTWNRNDNDCIIYWRGDDYKMHTNGTWKFIFKSKQKKDKKYIQEAIQLHDCFVTYSCKDNQSVGAKIISQLDSNNIFDHFYWLTNNLQVEILNIMENREENVLMRLYNEILYTIKNNRNDEIEHIINCGLINKIISYLTPHAQIPQTYGRYAMKILLLLLIHGEDSHGSNSQYKKQIISTFYHFLCGINDDNELLPDILECFAELVCISPFLRHECLKIGALTHIFNNVLEYNAIIQSVAVVAIYKFLSSFTNLDFALIDNDNEFLQKMANVLVALLEYAGYYDDAEMEQELLSSIEAFCGGRNSECRSRILVKIKCLQYIGSLLTESIKLKYTYGISPKKKQKNDNFQIESSCVRIIGNVLCDCIWSDFEDKTVAFLDEIKYLQIIHKLFSNQNISLSRDILWSLSNVLISKKGIEWILKYKQIIFDIIQIAVASNLNENSHNLKLKYDAGWCLCNAYRHSTTKQKIVFLKCGFQNVLLSLIGIAQINEKKSKKMTFLMQQIVKSTLMKDQQIKIKTKKFETQLKYILQYETDKIYINNFNKLLDIIQSGYIG